jgi:succinoglycan biosynthesis protein ExoV
MHGAIVSDAFRVPWLPVFGIDSHFNFKWKDWSDSMAVPFEFHKIKRLYIHSNPSFINKAKGWINQKTVEKQFNKLKCYHGTLSKDEVLEDRLVQIIEKINIFKSEYSRAIS